MQHFLFILVSLLGAYQSLFLSLSFSLLSLSPLLVLPKDGSLRKLRTDLRSRSVPHFRKEVRGMRLEVRKSRSSALHTSHLWPLTSVLPKTWTRGVGTNNRPFHIEIQLPMSIRILSMLYSSTCIL